MRSLRSGLTDLGLSIAMNSVEETNIPAGGAMVTKSNCTIIGVEVMLMYLAVMGN